MRLLNALLIVGVIAGCVIGHRIASVFADMGSVL